MYIVWFLVRVEAPPTKSFRYGTEGKMNATKAEAVSYIRGVCRKHGFRVFLQFAPGED